MIHNIQRIAGLLLSFLFIQGNVCAQEWNLFSPDKKINIRISNAESLSYSVSYDKRTVINDSPLGIQRDDQQFSGSLKFVEKNEGKIKEAYTLLVGKKLKSD